MDILSILTLSLLLLPADFIPASVESVVEPKPIANAVEGSVALADLLVGSSGKIQETVLMYGASPFSTEMLGAVRSWRFRAATSGGRPVDSHVGVLTIFRPPAIGNYAVGGPSLGYSVRPPGKSDHGPLPQFISDPGYPVNSVGQGTVVLELTIDRSGRLTNSHVVQNVPGLTELSTDEVQKWRFYPAVQSGQQVEGRLIVAIVYRRPVLANL